MLKLQKDSEEINYNIFFIQKQLKEQEQKVLLILVNGFKMKKDFLLNLKRRFLEKMILG